KATLRRQVALTGRRSHLKGSLPRQRNRSKPREFLVIPRKPWKGLGRSQPHLSTYPKRLCGLLGRLVCNQEIAGSIPLVSTQHGFLRNCQSRTQGDGSPFVIYDGDIRSVAELLGCRFVARP